MFYNFNAHRAKKAASEPDQTPAKQIFQKLTAIQRAWADLMQARAARLSGSWLKALSLTVLTACAAYSAYLIGDGIRLLHQGETPSFTRRLWPFDPEGAKDKLRRASGFQIYLDSLQKAAKKDSLNPIELHP